VSAARSGTIARELPLLGDYQRGSGRPRWIARRWCVLMVEDVAMSRVRALLTWLYTSDARAWRCDGCVSQEPRRRADEVRGCGDVS
jgi:hypothetical protein